jgi:hypothetical protein
MEYLSTKAQAQVNVSEYLSWSPHINIGVIHKLKGRPQKFALFFDPLPRSGMSKLLNPPFQTSALDFFQLFFFVKKINDSSHLT